MPAPTSPFTTCVAGLFFALALSSPPLFAEGPQSWFTASGPIAEAAGLTWNLEGGLRLSDGWGNPVDRRATLEVSRDIGGGSKAFGGFLIRHRDYEGVSAIDLDYRFIAGVEYPLPSGRSWDVTAETQYERHFGRPTEPAFNRYRQNFEIRLASDGLAPFIYEDFTFRNSGFIRSRSRAGVFVTLRGVGELTVAYQFESRLDDEAWQPRHAIYTELEIGSSE